MNAKKMKYMSNVYFLINKCLPSTNGSAADL